MAGPALTPDAAAAELRAVGARLHSRELQQQLLEVAKLDLQGGLARGVDPWDRPFAPLAFGRASGGTDHPLIDRGGLFNAIMGGAHHVEAVTETSFTFGVTGLPGADFLATGGTITPKGHPFLAIPKTPEAKAAKSPRNMAGLRPRIGKRGGVMVDESGNVQFALARSITAPAREFLAVGERMIRKLYDAAAAFVTGTRPEGGR